MGQLIKSMAPDQTQDELLAVYKMFVKAGTGEKTEQGITAKYLYRDLHAGDKRRGAWESYIETTENHNSPREFTTLIGWEWSAMPKGGTPAPTRGDYVRTGLKRGLEIQAQTGVNPYKVGMVGREKRPVFLSLRAKIP